MIFSISKVHPRVHSIIKTITKLRFRKFTRGYVSYRVLSRSRTRARITTDRDSNNSILSGPATWDDYLHKTSSKSPKSAWGSPNISRRKIQGLDSNLAPSGPVVTWVNEFGVGKGIRSPQSATGFCLGRLKRFRLLFVSIQIFFYILVMNGCLLKVLQYCDCFHLHH